MFFSEEEDDELAEAEDVDELEEVDAASFVDEPESFFEELDSDADFEPSDFEPSDEDAFDPFTDDVDADRESVMYQPLPLKTMPTGWMTLRNAPPHCSHVVKGASEKLCRFSTISSQAVHL